MTIPTLTTERLLLRPFHERDAEATYQILCGQDVLRYFPSSMPPPRERMEGMIGRLLAHWAEYGYGLWAVESQATGELLGRCGLQYLAELDTVEVDFILGRPYWGQGYATEAGQASLAYGFDELALAGIVGIAHVDNVASQKVLQKVGMTFVRAASFFGIDCYQYSLIASKAMDSI